jgi:hypothetical protein
MSSRCAAWRIVRGSSPRTSGQNSMDVLAHTVGARYSRRLYAAAAAHFRFTTNYRLYHKANGGIRMTMTVFALTTAAFYLAVWLWLRREPTLGAG